MGWLDDLNKQRVYIYKNKEGASIKGTLRELSKITNSSVNGERGEMLVVDDVDYFYAGFEPITMELKTAVEYEQNGRKAVMFRTKDGIKCISKTRLHYNKTGRVENQYTKGYKEYLEKRQQKEIMAVQNKYDPMKEMIKKLPDGEYLSDGVNITKYKGD